MNTYIEGECICMYRWRQREEKSRESEKRGSSCCFVLGSSERKRFRCMTVPWREQEWDWERF